jgi:hypothetical protein
MSLIFIFEALCSLWGTNLGLIKRSKRLAFYETRTGNRISRPLRDRYRKHGVCPFAREVQDISFSRSWRDKYKKCGSAREAGERVDDSNIPSHSKNKIKYRFPVGLHWRYSGIMGTTAVIGKITDRTRKTCDALRTFSNLFVYIDCETC